MCYCSTVTTHFTVVYKVTMVSKQEYYVLAHFHPTVSIHVRLLLQKSKKCVEVKINAKKQKRKGLL